MTSDDPNLDNCRSVVHTFGAVGGQAFRDDYRTCDGLAEGRVHVTSKTGKLKCEYG